MSEKNKRQTGDDGRPSGGTLARAGVAGGVALLKTPRYLHRGQKSNVRYLSVRICALDSSRTFFRDLHSQIVALLLDSDLKVHSPFHWIMPLSHIINFAICAVKLEYK